MNRMSQNIGSLVLILWILVAFEFPIKAQEQIQLFPDRSIAVSGDTIWFSLIIFNSNAGEMSGVVHVQLDNLKDKHISKVSVLCNGGIGKGYIPVPDSLSTGVYVLKAFSFIQKSDESAVVNQKLITVYNRFETEFFSINAPELNNEKKYIFSNDVSLFTVKDEFEKGEKVDVRMNIPQELINNTLQVIITAGLEDSLSDTFATSWFPLVHNDIVKFPISMVEKNGVLIAGKVHSSQNKQPVSNALVILSIPDTIPYLDYCVSDSAGMFYFYMRNAIGTADLVLQALTKDSMSCTIELFNDYTDTENTNSTEKILSHDELVFADNIVKASYFTKIFKGYNIESGDYFNLKRQFEYPFYGEPTETYYPDLFFDLPDFQEISREILYGVQYRERKNGPTIRLLDKGTGDFFSDASLYMLDGIPVFDPGIFSPLGTTDIDRVDVVFHKRFFGNLSFNGVLSVYTKKRSLTWLDENPSIGHFKYSCLQPPKTWNFRNTVVEKSNVPNFNKVLYRNSSDITNAPETFSFNTSDLKGNVVIRVILVQNNHQISYHQKIIKVE